MYFPFLTYNLTAQQCFCTVPYVMNLAPLIEIDMEVEYVVHSSVICYIYIVSETVTTSELG